MLAKVTSEPETLTAVDVSVSVSIISLLTEEASTDSQVSDNCVGLVTPLTLILSARYS